MGNLKKKEIPYYKYISVADNPKWSLDQWKEFIEELIKKYGKDSILSTDAGYNDVEMILQNKS